jgi:protein-S-isoprenylcysteine O-methyltransferase Ste14
MACHPERRQGFQSRRVDARPESFALVRMTLFWRALAAFVAFPLMVAFVVPWLLRPGNADFRAMGLPFLVGGTLLLLSCVWFFYKAGRGTLAPWSPPKHLVTVGPYRFSRNPMYVAVLLVLIGWAIGYGSTAHWIYAGVLAIAFQLRIVSGEEPWLAQTHGGEWTTYRAEVSRWLGRHRRST